MSPVLPFAHEARAAGMLMTSFSKVIEELCTNPSLSTLGQHLFQPTEYPQEYPTVSHMPILPERTGQGTCLPSGTGHFYLRDHPMYLTDIPLQPEILQPLA